MIVERFRSTARPLGTGMSSNSLRCGREADDAHPARITSEIASTVTRRIRVTSCGSCYRRPARAAKLLAVVGVIFAVGGCASALADSGRPPQDTRLPSDEQKRREDAGKESRRLAGGTRAYDDPALAAYLTTIARRLAPADAPAVTVLVLREPLPGAFALPDGTVAVHTGLLARVDNEAQLAAVLGREVAHAAARHAAAAGATASADGFPPTPPLFVGADLPMARAADLDGQGRQRERDADRAAIEAMARAGSTRASSSGPSSAWPRTRRPTPRDPSSWGAGAGAPTASTPPETSCKRAPTRPRPTARPAMRRSSTAGSGPSSATTPCSPPGRGASRSPGPRSTARSPSRRPMRQRTWRRARSSAWRRSGAGRRRRAGGARPWGLRARRRPRPGARRAVPAARSPVLPDGARAEARAAWQRYLELSPERGCPAHPGVPVRAPAPMSRPPTRRRAARWLAGILAGVAVLVVAGSSSPDPS